MQTPALSIDQAQKTIKTAEALLELLWELPTSSVAIGSLVQQLKHHSQPIKDDHKPPRLAPRRVRRVAGRLLAKVEWQLRRRQG